MEPLKSCLEVVERTFGDDIAVGNVAEVKERSKCLHDVQRDKPLDRIQVYLRLERSVGRLAQCCQLTFIKALESSLVHWLKFLPCLNQHKPGNGGASAILPDSECMLRERIDHQPAINFIEDAFHTSGAMTVFEIL